MTTARVASIIRSPSQASESAAVRSPFHTSSPATPLDATTLMIHGSLTYHNRCVPGLRSRMVGSNQAKVAKCAAELNKLAAYRRQGCLRAQIAVHLQHRASKGKRNPLLPSQHLTNLPEKIDAYVRLSRGKVSPMTLLHDIRRPRERRNGDGSSFAPLASASHHPFRQTTTPPPTLFHPSMKAVKHSLCTPHRLHAPCT